MSDDLRTRLERTLQDRYAILGELGGGGMARVFLAEEIALARKVVIKVLMPELAAGLSAKRFEREIRLAASLQHANIVPVLSAGIAADLPMYTMPFVDGRSLRALLEQDGTPALEGAIAMLRDIARALAYSHERGVVHRDIKPENVLLAGDAAVVTDFGIAKAISAARGDGSPAGATQSTVTMAGSAVGTPAYMAPEQIAGGDEVDHRADLYSLGCLAYELLCGERPFPQSSPTALFAAHLSQVPTPIHDRVPACPPALGRLVMQCLQKDAAARPPSARHVLQELERSGTTSTAMDRWRRRVRIGNVPRVMAVAAVVLLTAFGVFQFVRGRVGGAVAQESLAVIPFVNLRSDTSTEYLSDGLSDGVATALGRLPRLRVVARTATYRYRDARDLDARAVGRALRAGWLVHGQVRDLAGRVRVSVQLTNANDNSEEWSDHFDGDPGDALALQRAVNAAIVRGLQELLGMAPDVATSRPAGGTADRQAYDLYLRGRFLLLRRGAGVSQAVENFRQSAARDSMFAEAHAALALALQLRPYFEPVSAAEMRGPSIAAASRALMLDSSLAEGHTALAMVHQHAFEWDRAEASYREALRLGSEDVDTYIQFGRFLFYMGRFREALSQFTMAQSMDPYSAVASGWVGHLKDLSGDARGGLEDIMRALQIDSTNPPVVVFASQALHSLGRDDEARRLLEQLWTAVPPWRHAVAVALAIVGDATRATELLDRLAARDTPLPTQETWLAMLRLVTGDTARALDHLERATRIGEIWPMYYSLSEREFDALRSNSRFASIARDVGLDVDVFTSQDGGRRR